MPYRWHDLACESVQGVGMWSLKAQPYMEGPSRGEGGGLGRERLQVGGGVGMMSARHSSASKNDSRWSDTQPKSSHYHESTGRVECCERKGEWAKKAETEPDNPRWKIHIGSFFSLTHTRVHASPKPQTNPHTHLPKHSSLKQPLTPHDPINPPPALVIFPTVPLKDEQESGLMF